MKSSNNSEPKACAVRKMADFAIVGEPTNLDVVYTHKGTAWIEIETRGKSVHASLPETGVNAIDRMTDTLKILNERFPEICPVRAGSGSGQTDPQYRTDPRRREDQRCP